MTKIESEHIFVQKISCAKSVAAKIQWEYRLALTESRIFSRQLSDGFLSAFSYQPKISWFPNLKFLQVFFQSRGEILVFLKNVEFLEFFGFTLCFRTFQAKKKLKFFFQPTDRNFLQINYMNS